MAVKRYHDSVGAKRLHERPDGEFVRHEDYAALELRLEAAESALSDDGVYGDHNLIPSYEMEISQLKKEILTLHAFCKPEDLSAAYLAIGSESGIHNSDGHRLRRYYAESAANDR